MKSIDIEEQIKPTVIEINGNYFYPRGGYNYLKVILKNTGALVSHPDQTENQSADMILNKLSERGLFSPKITALIMHHQTTKILEQFMEVEKE